MTMIDDSALSERIEARLRDAPRSAGVYLMRDSRGDILYIGKAKDLRSRVRSYFRSVNDGRYQIQFLIDRVADIEYLVTASEKDALLLENNLIKKAKPRFNIRLRDDKSYVILRVNVQHHWPRAQVTRGFRDDGALYFGPYSSADKLRNTIRALQRVFPLRLCTDHTLDTRTRPCVYYDIKMCSAPCVDKVSETAYRGYVEGLIAFMKGRDRSVLDDLRRRMQGASAARRYEEAAELRDRIDAITLTIEKQATEETGETYDRDVFGYHWQGEELGIQALFYRQGKLTHSSMHRFRALMPMGELLSSFLVQFYEGERMVPPEILLPVDIEDSGVLADWLAEKSGRSIRIVNPRRGDKLRQVELAARNAAQALKEGQSERERHAELLGSLKEKLDLRNSPERIECYDISHLGGRETVGSRVVFSGGAPDKDRYRRYRVRGATQGDDFAALGEVLERRLRRGIAEGDLPDLMIIDGGKGQLGRVRQVMTELNIVDIDVVGIAKARRRRRGGQVVLSEERVVKDDRDQPIVLKQDSPENHFLVRVRDEAHRFAITYHRRLKRRQLTRSHLEDIPGIGPKRRAAILRHLGSLDAVKKASIDELAQVPGLGGRAAAQVFEFFHPGRRETSRQESPDAG